ncbi:MAG TPA: BON domain-containing protein [Longimicrobiaceae bacterium]|nr:BON domain-containing protein [Longimicrobiaceae bacterium]
MWEFRERHESDAGTEALSFLLGAAGGFAIGMLLSGRMQPAARTASAGAGRVRALGGNLRARADTLRERARTVASRLRPARLRRPAVERTELSELEDAVLDAFLADEVLSERGIDVGAISRGIIELSGSVYTEEEADRAVSVARRVPGVETVVNRMEVESQMRRTSRTRDRGDEDQPRAPGGAEWTGLQSGMGRRRQGRETDPPRSDDAQHIREVSLEITDRSEFEQLGYAARPRNAERPEDSRGNGPEGYSEDELDNQEPVGPHTYGGIPREPTGPDLNPGSRVGEGLKPGTELRLERADVPVKPHGEGFRGRQGATDDEG